MEMEDLFLGVAMEEVYVDEVCLGEIGEVRVPCEMSDVMQLGTSEYAQTKVAHWCWGMTVSEVGKHDTTSLPELTSQLVFAWAEDRSGQEMDGFKTTDQRRPGR